MIEYLVRPSSLKALDSHSSIFVIFVFLVWLVTDRNNTMEEFTLVKKHKHGGRNKTNKQQFKIQTLFLPVSKQGETTKMKIRVLNKTNVPFSNFHNSEFSCCRSIVEREGAFIVIKKLKSLIVHSKAVQVASVNDSYANVASGNTSIKNSIFVSSGRGKKIGSGEFVFGERLYYKPMLKLEPTETIHMSKVKIGEVMSAVLCPFATNPPDNHKYIYSQDQFNTPFVLCQVVDEINSLEARVSIYALFNKNHKN